MNPDGINRRSHMKWLRSAQACKTAMLVVHASLLLYLASCTSPVKDEPGHLVAGIRAWRTADFRFYMVNPPLVKLLSALPAVLLHASISDDVPTVAENERTEWLDGAAFIERNRETAFAYLFLGRCMLIPVMVLGAYTCGLWSRDLFGSGASVVAVTLWSFSPNLLAWGAVGGPDAAATSLGVCASYRLYKWRSTHQWRDCVYAGIALGIALLSKFTFIVFIPVWMVLCVATPGFVKAHSVNHRMMIQLPTCFLIAIYMINLGYGFQGTCQTLRSFQFSSVTLGGADTNGGKKGNRWDNEAVMVGYVPVPLPANYVYGMDLQKRELEVGKPSYVLGTWSERGRWFYYLVALAVKVPLGTHVLAGSAMCVAIYRACRCRVKWGSFGDWLSVAMPPAAIMAAASMNTGFTHHFRYVLPVVPYLMIIGSGCCTAPKKALSGALTVWAIASSLCIVPHSLSYFNELIGGPLHGHAALLDSNIDCGQDEFHCDAWRDRHPEASPIRMLHANSFSRFLSETEGPPPVGALVRNDSPTWQLGPRSGWYACSVQAIRHVNSPYRYFLEFTPREMVGYSIAIYHITPSQADAIRARNGLELLHVNAQQRSLPFESLSPESDVLLGVIAIFDCESEREAVAAKAVRDSIKHMTCHNVTAKDIHNSGLQDANVLVVPGGSAHDQAIRLGNYGGEKVREFVRNGGAYIGICAGAYLATAEYDWSLALANCRALSGEIDVSEYGMRSMAERGSGTPLVSLTTDGSRLLGTTKRDVEVTYAGGPVLMPAGREDLPVTVPLAIYRSEVVRYEPQRDTMSNTPAILMSRFGKGVVILISPHLEMAPSTRDLLERCIRLAVRNCQYNQRGNN